MKIFVALFVLCALTTGINCTAVTPVQEMVQAWIIVWIGNAIDKQYTSMQYTDELELPVADALVAAGEYNLNMEPVFSGTEIESIGGVQADPNNNYDYKFFVLRRAPRKINPPTEINLSPQSPFTVTLINRYYYLFWLRSDF